MNIIRQPMGSSLCGQTCVAMLANITLEESVAVFKKRGATTTKDVISALRALGIDCGDGLLRVRKHEMPPLCLAILHFSWDSVHAHWTIYNNGIFYDPAIGIIKEYPKGVRITSFLPILRKEDPT